MNAGRALFGDPLIGWSRVRYVYVDEAGISESEPVRVVSGVIVHPDNQWRAVERRLSEVFDRYVPASLRKGFVFTAKRIFNMGKEERELWGDEARWNLLRDVLAMPLDMGLPIVVGMVRKDSLDEFPPKIARFDFEHAMAFYYCAAAADEYLRRHTGEDEVATLVSEDFPKSKKAVNAAIKALRQKPRKIAASRLLRKDYERRHGVRLQSGELMIQKIVGNPHFEAKDGVPLLQLADACAFTFRRYFAGESCGEELQEMLLRAPLKRSDWRGGGSSACFVRPPVDGW